MAKQSKTKNTRSKGTRSTAKKPVKRKLSRPKKNSSSSKKKPIKDITQSWSKLKVVFLGFILSVFISIGFYFLVIKPYAYRWLPCGGLKRYGVCLPYGYQIHGIDISRHQGVIDWPKLSIYQNAEQPIKFIFMKATEGSDFKDVTFDENFCNAQKYGFVRGAYHFFSPLSSAQKQASFFIKNVQLQKGDLPPVLDVEVVGGYSKKSLRDSVVVWLDLVEKHYNTKPILYTSYKFKKKYLNDSIFDENPFWIAHYYVKSVRYEGEWCFWQHTDIGSVPGIDKYVDLNVFNGSMIDFLDLTIK